MMVAKAGKMVAFPSGLTICAGMPPLMPPAPAFHRNFSKVILRHSNLSTTQRYLGKITDTEAMKWIENLYGGARSSRPKSTCGAVGFLHFLLRIESMSALRSHPRYGASD